jgi:twinkle protein
MPPDFNRFTTGAAHRAAPGVPERAQPAEALLPASAVWAELRHAWFNEDPNGLPTHFPTLAPHWSWLPDEVTLVTGWPGHGKSELMLQLMLTKSVYEGWKWALYVPENMPARRAITKLVQSYVGQSANPKSPSRMSFAQFEEASQWVLQHFHLINPRKAASLAELLPVLRHAVATHQVKGCLIDPWNSLSSNLKDYGGREDEMLRAQLNELLDFAEDNHQCVVVCAHPSGEARTKDKEMSLRVPDQYSVSGGRMWANKVDNFLVVHRPYADDDPTNTAVDFYARKIKQEGLVGMKTPKEGVRLSYMRATSRYIDPKLGHAPLDVLARQRYQQTGTNEVLAPAAQAPLPLRTASPNEFGDDWHLNGKPITIPTA